MITKKGVFPSQSHLFRCGREIECSHFREMRWHFRDLGLHFLSTAGCDLHPSSAGTLTVNLNIVSTLGGYHQIRGDRNHNTIGIIELLTCKNRTSAIRTQILTPQGISHYISMILHWCPYRVNSKVKSKLSCVWIKAMSGRNTCDHWCIRPGQCFDLEYSKRINTTFHINEIFLFFTLGVSRLPFT